MAGVGGTTLASTGPLAWFAIGGRRFENPTVTFARPAEGSFLDTYTLGNVGQTFLTPFRIVFDYPRRRIAFVPRDGLGD
jgi:hypothetical protein